MHRMVSLVRSRSAGQEASAPSHTAVLEPQRLVVLWVLVQIAHIGIRTFILTAGCGGTPLVLVSNGRPADVAH